MRRLPLRHIVLACLVTVLFVGCGKTDPSGSVKGKVTLDDAPYSAEASVVFMSTETGQAGSANIGSDGTFSLEKPLPVGAYVVFIGNKSSSVEVDAEAPTPEKPDEALPAKYRNEATTDIKIDIVEGDNDVTVPLKK